MFKNGSDNNYSMQQNRIEREIESTSERMVKKAPFEMRVVEFFGLHSFMFKQLVFKCKRAKYSVSKINNVNTLINGKNQIYEPPHDYSYVIEVLEQDRHSVPVLRLTPSNWHGNRGTIIYAHGNSSDMYDSLTFIEKMTKIIRTEYIIFDYSGYGVSSSTEITQETICRDIEIVLAWTIKQRSIHDIILWGFSLGTFPVVNCSSKYPVRAVILQSPLASISCLFEEELNPNMVFQNDFLSNLSIINRINSYLLIVHSLDDEVIPFSHAKLLRDKYVESKGETKIELIEVTKLNHNQIHRYLCCDLANPLQTQFVNFYHRVHDEFESRASEAEIEIEGEGEVSEKSNKATGRIRIFSKERPSRVKKLGEGMKSKNKRKMVRELHNLYEELDVKSIKNDQEEEFEIVTENGKKKKVITNKKIADAFGCFCL